jgi:hypothetical protein
MLSLVLSAAHGAAKHLYRRVDKKCSPVMLSAAKHLDATRDRPSLSMTGIHLLMSSIDQEINYEVQKSLPGD